MGQDANQMSATSTDDPEVIAADIAQTRAEMSGTIDAIQQRLSPDALGEQAKEKVEDLTEQAKEAAREAVQEAKEAVRETLLEARDNVREATIGRVETMVRNAGDTAQDTREGLMGTIRQNPVPAALVGIGLGWLWMNRQGGSSRRDGGRNERYYRGERYDRGERGAYIATSYDRYGAADTYPRRGGDEGDSGGVRQAVGNVAGQVGSAAGSAAGSVGETVGSAASSVGETVGNAASAVGDTASNLASATQERAQRVEDRFGQAIQENPLAVGAVALAIGAAVGLALPQTQRENQLLGEARDTLVERAQDLAQETIGKVQSVASEAQGSVQESMQEVKETVKEESKKQGLTQ